jgi:hypothetical protein
MSSLVLVPSDRDRHSRPALRPALGCRRIGRLRRVRRSGVRHVAAACLGSLLASACGAPMLKLPAGPGSPAGDGPAVLEEATSACRDVRTLTAEIAVSGSAGGHRLRTRLLAGIATPASARLEAVAPFGPPFFIFVAVDGDSTLLLPRDGRVLDHGRPDAVLDAIAGVPLGAAELISTLTGCPSGPGYPAQARAIGSAWRVVPGGVAREIYLRRDADAGRWRLVAVVEHRGDGRAWRVEFRDFRAGLPRIIRVASVEQAGNDVPFDLRLTLSQVELNTPLEAAVFQLRVPDGYAPITLEELREAGPLGLVQGKTD